MSKKKNRITFAGIINAIILGLFTLICVYPLWYIFINSWSSPAAVNRGVYIIPQEFSTEAYTNLLEIPGLTSSIGIAFARTILGTLLTLLCCSFAAYLLANRDLPCRKLLYRFFIVTMYVNAGFIPYYLLISNIGLKNNFLVYILPYAVQAYFIILIKTYIESIPSELVESAEMDGAGLVKVFFRIILPLAKPILACIVVFAAVNQWIPGRMTCSSCRAGRRPIFTACSTCCIPSCSPMWFPLPEPRCRRCGGQGNLNYASHGNELYYGGADFMCISLYAAVFYQRNYAGCRKGMTGSYFHCCDDSALQK